MHPVKHVKPIAEVKKSMAITCLYQDIIQIPNWSS